jgi:hypothetical protein
VTVDGRIISVASGRSKTETGLKFVVSEVDLEEATGLAVMADELTRVAA